jgi:hypothetical protein
MEPHDLLPYLGFLIGGAIVIPIAGIMASVHNTRLRIKHGYPLQGTWGQALKPGSDQASQERIKLLTQENAQLRAEIGSMQDRLVVVERIVTERGYHLGAEIEKLRDSKGNVQ